MTRWSGRTRWGSVTPVVAVVLLALAACGSDGTTLVRAPDAAAADTTVSTTTVATTASPAPTISAPPSTTTAPTAPPTTAPAPPPTTAAPTTAMPPAPTTTRVPVPRVVADTGFSPFATAEALVLVHPAAQVERIGFHESGHDGSRQMEVAASATRPMVLETRDRGTGDRTAADIVVPPDTEIRVPVTGTVKRAGGYILYCEHQDDFAVIEPDARPGWEVKIFHIDGVQVRAGDRVEAGVTVLAPRATMLPFESQVNEFTAEPSWPHVHVEVVDPSIPDRPSPGGGC